ncbi:MAG: 4a-hydroxytetrahydrobiopterin dehydratase [Candidatus Promineifilaceae bacterium]
MERRKLTRAELERSLDGLPGWELIDSKLHKTFKFDSFAEAIGWMTTVAIFAEKIDHHPEWSNVYNRVTVNLITHDLDALSTLDIALAQKMQTTFPGG